MAVQAATIGPNEAFLAVLTQLATFNIVIGSLYSIVAAIQVFGIFAAVKVCL